MVATIAEMAKEFYGALDVAETAGEKLGNRILELLKPVLPGLEFGLGWAEAGIDTLCFSSNLYYASATRRVGLSGILYEFIKDVDIKCPYGVYATSEQAEQIRRILKDA